MEDVKVGGVIAIPKGSTAVGHVVEAEPRKRMGRAGKLNFTVDHVKAPDDSNLRLRASSTRKGEDKTGTVIVGTVLLSPLFLYHARKRYHDPERNRDSSLYRRRSRDRSLIPSARSKLRYIERGAVGFRPLQIGSGRSRHSGRRQVPGNYAFKCAVDTGRSFRSDRQTALRDVEEDHLDKCRVFRQR